MGDRDGYVGRRLGPSDRGSQTLGGNGNSAVIMPIRSLIMGLSGFKTTLVSWNRTQPLGSSLAPWVAQRNRRETVIGWLRLTTSTTKRPYPWRCLCLGLVQITMTRPRRRIIRHFSHILRTEALTFMD